MDVPSGFRQPAGKRRGGQRGMRGQHGQGYHQPELFEDTSVQQQPPQQVPYGYNNYGYDYGMQPQGQVYDQPGYGDPGMPEMQAFPGQQYINDPMAHMAMQYGSTLADQGKDLVHKNLEKYVSTSKIKYYFAVDTAYVGKKLGLLCFPFTHSDWSIKFNQEEPIAPRFEVNAPDLYIPVMGFVTYILVAGIVLGTQNRFTPEQLGIQASTAFVWLVIELLAALLSLYVMAVRTDITYLDIIAYTGYKFVGMIFSMLSGMVFRTIGYYLALLWFSLSIVFFLIRTLRVQILPHTQTDGFTQGSKRNLYLILCISLTQPILMWWLTRHIVFS